MKQLNYDIDSRRFQKTSIEGKFSYDIYYLHDYYPKKHFPNVCKNINTVRRNLYDFKDGRRTMIDDFKKVTVNKDANKSEYILINIPASTKDKTTLRYKKFMNEYSSYLGIENGYSVINVIDHEELKGDINIDRLQYFEIEEARIKNKKIILIDDVKTSGKTFCQVADKLMELGAKKVLGSFYCQTVDYRDVTDFEL